MKKKFYKVSNLLLGSFITMLGLGACKCSKNLDNIEAVYGPPPGYIEEMEKQRAEYERAEQERVKQEQQLLEQKRREAERFKTVYGPPPSMPRSSLSTRRTPPALFLTPWPFSTRAAAARPSRTWGPT